MQDNRQSGMDVVVVRWLQLQEEIFWTLRGKVFQTSSCRLQSPIILPRQQETWRQHNRLQWLNQSFYPSNSRLCRSRDWQDHDISYPFGGFLIVVDYYLHCLGPEWYEMDFSADNPVPDNLSQYNSHCTLLAALHLETPTSSHYISHCTQTYRQSPFSWNHIA